jgi:hypothetical protein
MQPRKRCAKRGLETRRCETMNAASGNNGSGHRAGWWAALLALLGVASDVPRLGISPVAAQPEIQRLAVQAPPSWQEFAMQLQGKLLQRLGADGEAISTLAKQLAGGGSDFAGWVSAN